MDASLDLFDWEILRGETGAEGKGVGGDCLRHSLRCSLMQRLWKNLEHQMHWDGLDWVLKIMWQD